MSEFERIEAAPLPELISYVPPDLIEQIGLVRGQREERLFISGLWERQEDTEIFDLIQADWPDHYRTRALDGFRHHVQFTLLELLKNSARHAHGTDRSRPLDCALVYGERGVVLGVKDEGDFYRRSSTKEQLEARQLIDSTSEPPGGFGTRHLAEFPHEVEIDLEQGICWVLMLLPSTE